MPVITSVNLLVDARKLIPHHRDLNYRVFHLASYCDPLIHWRGHIFSRAGAVETLSPDRQSTYESNGRLKVLPWMVRLGDNEYFRFCLKYFGMKADRRFHRSTDIVCPCSKDSPQYYNGKKSYLFAMDLSHFVPRHGMVWLIPLPEILIVSEQYLEDNIQKYEYWSFSLIPWMTNHPELRSFIDIAPCQNWDGSPNSQPWVVRWAIHDFAFSTALLSAWHLNTSSRKLGLKYVCHPPPNP